jgi:hypothetical protein
LRPREPLRQERVVLLAASYCQEVRKVLTGNRNSCSPQDIYGATFSDHRSECSKKDTTCQFSDKRSRSHLRVNDELCDFTATIRRSKSSHQVMWLLLANTYLETNRTHEGKPETSKRRLGASSLPSGSREGVTQGDLSIDHYLTCLKKFG